MANEEHVAQLRKGANSWEAWCKENPDIHPDLKGANLRGADLRNVNLGKAILIFAKLDGADLRGALLHGANLFCAKLDRADLRGAHLVRTRLCGANLIKADLSGALLLNSNFTNADLTGCRVHGVSAWGLKLDGAKQQNLIITPENEPEITVDNIEVAQFVYLLLHNPKIRDVIDTIGKKGVLLLGRFTEGRMVVLERLRDKLRDLGFVPMVFNFDKPETRDFTETVRLLCSLSKFVIVDITNPRSALLELQATVPDYMVPFAPILQQGEQPFAMFVDLQNKYDWVLQPVIRYPTVDRLVEVLEDKIVRPAEAKLNELLARRTRQLRVESVEEEAVVVNADKAEESSQEVRLGASAPPSISVGETFVARFAAYTDANRDEVKAAIKREAPRSQLRPDLDRCRWRRGTKVTVRLECSNATISNPVQTFSWDGSYKILRFDVTVANQVPANSLILCFDVAVEGFPITSLRPEIHIKREKPHGGAIPLPSFFEVRTPRSAFASYVASDRREVLGRVRSVQISTGIDVFLDCLSIRPGEQWKPKLRHEIVSRDIFWLFWSRKAMKSPWVNWEWRTALAQKSINGIQPHPLEPSDLAPAPKELSALQFGAMYEWYIVHLRQLAPLRPAAQRRWNPRQPPGGRRPRDPGG